ncbi:type II toxin-antitoxin system YafO family toxin [Kushneria aurantia]|uniref:Type II toxin-antitoxin system YafO family toxin n=1 Tax=Kushneria aurantia TaxID=504092 RepID=A0ABV6G6F8_9GAMM|nr:type II toxin-antitoxin system YafO family toxin [Kushneria aurantia]
MIDVSFHPETEYLFDEVEAAHPGLKSELVQGFRTCIESNFDVRAPRFGKFDPYLQPPSVLSAELWHVHICMPPRRDFDARRLRWDEMKCRTDEPELDAALVYVQGLMDRDAYCLIAFLYPKAHHKSNQDAFMKWLARLGKQFRRGH